MLLLPMDKNGKKEDAGGIIPKAPNKFNKIFNKIIIPQPNPITMPSSFFCLIEAPKINITSAAKTATTTIPAILQ